MNRRFLTAGTLHLGILLIGAFAGSRVAASAPPNVVVIVIDDLGYADIGLTGASPYQLPHLDRLVREGMVFTDFVSSAPVCSASRAALMTGCYHRRVGISGALFPKASHGIHERETTLGELCQAQGYATACFGKWHLGHHPKFLPLQHGFDEYYGLPYSNDMWPHHPHFAEMSEHDAVKRGRYPPLPMIDGNEVVDADVSAEDQALLTRRCTERAVAFIENNHDRPFFLYVPHSMVHVPLFASERFRGQSPHGLFGDVMREIDWSVGEILNVLDKTGNADNTLVIFTSDNGPWLPYGDHAGSALPLREGKGTTFEGGVRLPTVMRWPQRIASGSTCPELCGMIDVLPTVAELIDVPLPAHPIDGKSVVSLLSGTPGARSPHEGLCYYYQGQLQAVRDRRWKLHFPHKYPTLAGKPGGTGGKPVPMSQAEIGLELFDLSNDIGEQTDVAASHPEVVARLQAAADQVRAQLGEGKETGSESRPAGRLTAEDPRLVWAAGPTLCVGNHHSESDGIAQLNRFRATFHDLETWKQRAAATRRQLLQQSGLDPLPPRTPLNPIVRNRRKHPGYTVESVSFEALPGFFVYGSLYRPASPATAPHPGVLSVHGHWGEPNEGARFRPDNQLRCATLARMGAVVLGIDMIGYGESARQGWKHHHERSMLLQLWSNHRAIDFLCSLDDVDPDRLAVTGASGGGTQSLQLALTDDRIQVSVPVCMVSAHFFGGCICESGAPVYLTPEHETNLVDMAAAFAPKPQLLISVGGDWSCNTPEVEYPYLRDVYELWGAADAVANAHFADEGHDYGASKRQALYDFLAQHLGLDREAEDETVVAQESADEMCVFDEEHPLPDHALAPNQWPHVR